MYGYEEYIDITPEQILQKVSQKAIFEFILGEELDFNRRYRSPLRVDNEPGCRFAEREDGTILFIDFGSKDGVTHRSCFSFVADKYRVSIREAIKIVCNKFGLSSDSKDYSFISEGTYTPVESSHAIITYDRRDYNKSDRIYWSQFLIKEEELLVDNTHASARFRITTSQKKMSFETYKHCYVFDFIDRLKIYQPYSIKYKFLTNCDEDSIGNIDNLPATGDKLYIEKAYKDHRILRNLFSFNVIWLHNEGSIPSLEILVNLVSRFKQIIVFFDNDFKGIQAGYKLVCVLNNIRKDCAVLKYLPIRCPYKDIGELVPKEGRKDSIKLLNQIL